MIDAKPTDRLILGHMPMVGISYQSKEIFSVIIKTADIAFSSYDGAVQSFVNKELKSTNAIIDSQKEIGRDNYAYSISR